MAIDSGSGTITGFLVGFHSFEYVDFQECLSLCLVTVFLGGSLSEEVVLSESMFGSYGSLGRFDVEG